MDKQTRLSRRLQHERTHPDLFLDWIIDRMEPAVWKKKYHRLPWLRAKIRAFVRREIQITLWFQELEEEEQLFSPPTSP